MLDLWFEKSVKPRLRGEAYLTRYIDDFVVCFQYQEDAIRFQKALVGRLAKFSLKLEPNKTRLVSFGRFAQRKAAETGKKVDTVYFLGFTHFCTRNRKGNFMVGRKTEKSRFKRSVQKVQVLLHELMHHPIEEQIKKTNQFLRGHYAYYGLGGNLKTLQALYRITERWWKKVLDSRSRKSYIPWSKFCKLKEQYPIVKPKLSVPYGRMHQWLFCESKAEERSAVTLHATICGGGSRKSDSLYPVRICSNIVINSFRYLTHRLQLTQSIVYCLTSSNANTDPYNQTGSNGNRWKKDTNYIVNDRTSKGTRS